MSYVEEVLLCTRLCCATADLTKIGESCWCQKNGVFGRVKFDKKGNMQLEVDA